MSYFILYLFRETQDPKEVLVRSVQLEKRVKLDQGVLRERLVQVERM